MSKKKAKPIPKKVPAKYTHLSSFHWQSSLDEARKLELIAWEAKLSPTDRKKFHDLLDDARADEAGIYAEEAAGASM